DVFNSAAGSNATVIAKITNNTIDEPDTTGGPSAALQRGIAYSIGNSGGSSESGCLNATSNSITGAWPLPIRITTLNTPGTLQIPGLSPSSGATAAQVQSFVSGLNGGVTVVASIGGAINGGGPCPE